ncbi:MAG: fumarylacetoacetate hydrolase family protein [Flavobacteriaceae bacterium]|nr:fumarylacetoacetate hydrolase family protein [Mangrovimonas sp.]MCB0427727.1 fumarylacetoacetate hydrolase family protein [Mangrovimonas sp.]MCB0435080.1 fumarylacetoacetate hydrolase family protein [Mangrovimonas sp.]HPF97596.1 fumarylacetoacetate hydrolase family protein [Mangrovimonas sp.]HRV55236.1 fumarylacetoacetate hydrolase family protein [Mangrovimonas sp.]
MKFICIGRNYVDHIEELNNPRPDEPIIFLKPDSALLIKDQPFFIPEFSEDIHHEVEILVKINKIGKHIDRKFAHKYYDEIGLGIDFTARDLQKKLKDQGLPWERAKSFDGAAVVGNWLPKEQFENIDDIGFSLTKNGDVVQQGNTSLMLWKIDEIIEFVSKYFTLKIGDVIFTGTPKGVSKVVANDTLEGYVGKTQLLSIKIK